MPNNDKTIKEITTGLTQKIQGFKPAPALRWVAKIIQIIAAIAYGLATAGFIMALWWIMSGRDVPSWIHLSTADRYIAVILGYVAVSSPLLLLERAFDRASEQAGQSRISSIVEAVIAAVWLLSLLALGIFILMR